MWEVGKQKQKQKKTKPKTKPKIEASSQPTREEATGIAIPFETIKSQFNIYHDSK